MLKNLLALRSFDSIFDPFLSFAYCYFLYHRAMLFQTKKTTEAYQICILHDSFYPPTKQCGHWAPLAEMVDQMHRQGFSLKCPHCDESVSFIKDSVVAKKNPEDETVTFKFGKTVYCLSVTGGANTAPLGWLDWCLQRLHIRPYRITAQARIADALRLDSSSMKILSKGKIVFSSSSQTKSDIFHDFAISQTLTDQGAEDDGLVNRSPNPRLLVMGTPRDVISPKASSIMDLIRNVSVYDLIEWTIRSLFQIGANLIRFLFLGKSTNKQD